MQQKSPLTGAILNLNLVEISGRTSNSTHPIDHP